MDVSLIELHVTFFVLERDFLPMSLFLRNTKCSQNKIKIFFNSPVKRWKFLQIEESVPIAGMFRQLTACIFLHLTKCFLESVHKNDCAFPKMTEIQNNNKK